MYKLKGKQTLDDCKWYGVDEPQTEEEKRAALEALRLAMEREERRERNRPKYNKDHHGGEEF